MVFVGQLPPHNSDLMKRPLYLNASKQVIYFWRGLQSVSWVMALLAMECNGMLGWKRPSVGGRAEPAVLVGGKGREMQIGNLS